MKYQCGFMRNDALRLLRPIPSPLFGADYCSGMEKKDCFDHFSQIRNWDIFFYKSSCGYNETKIVESGIV